MAELCRTICPNGCIVASATGCHLNTIDGEICTQGGVFVVTGDQEVCPAQCVEETLQPTTSCGYESPTGFKVCESEMIFFESPLSCVAECKEPDDPTELGGCYTTYKLNYGHCDSSHLFNINSEYLCLPKCVDSLQTTEQFCGILNENGRIYYCNYSFVYFQEIQKCVP